MAEDGVGPELKAVALARARQGRQAFPVRPKRGCPPWSSRWEEGGETERQYDVFTVWLVHGLPTWTAVSKLTGAAIPTISGWAKKNRWRERAWLYCEESTSDSPHLLAAQRMDADLAVMRTVLRRAQALTPSDFKRVPDLLKALQGLDHRNRLDRGLATQNHGIPKEFLAQVGEMMFEFCDPLRRRELKARLDVLEADWQLADDGKQTESMEPAALPAAGGSA